MNTTAIIIIAAVGLLIARQFAPRRLRPLPLGDRRWRASPEHLPGRPARPLDGYAVRRRSVSAPSASASSVTPTVTARSRATRESKLPEASTRASAS
jgi:hypothetical protein